MMVQRDPAGKERGCRGCQDGVGFSKSFVAHSAQKWWNFEIVNKEIMKLARSTVL